MSSGGILINETIVRLPHITMYMYKIVNQILLKMTRKSLP